MKIFVAGLPYDLDDAELEEIFEKFGKVDSAKVAMDKMTGKSRGFGFVEMPIEEEAKDAIENLNDISLGKSHWWSRLLKKGSQARAARISIDVRVAFSRTADQDASKDFLFQFLNRMVCCSGSKCHECKRWILCTG